MSDSLKAIYRETLSDTLKDKYLKTILNNEQDRDSVISYGKKYLSFAKEKGVDNDICYAYTKLGTAYKDKASFSKALVSFLKSLEYAKDSSRKAISYSNIAGVYLGNGDYNRAIGYYRDTERIFKKLGDSLRLGSTLVSFGYAFFRNRQPDSAIVKCSEAKEIFGKIDHPYGDYYWAYAQGNLALGYASLNQFVLAEQGLEEAIKVLQNYGDYYALADYKLQLAKIYLEKGNPTEALPLAKAGLELSKKNSFKERIMDGNEIMFKINSSLGNFRDAFEFQSAYIVSRDSVVNADLIRKLADQQKEYEVSQKQAEVDLLTVEKQNQRIILLAVASFAFVLVILAFVIYRFYQSKARINQVLETQKEKLESLNETKDKFFSIISHDLRGPVSSFMGISRMIKHFVNTKDTNQLLEVADDIDNSVRRLSTLLDNLLTWAMQQQGHFPNVPEKLNFNELADELVQTLDTMASAKNIRLFAEIDDSVTLWADKNTTMTIIRNLVSNSLKFTPDNGEVKITAREQGKYAQISISDTGVGIPKEKLEALFKLQAKKSTFGTSGEKGLGLGLQLVNEFIEMNGGRIKVDSKEGEGSTFTVWLPLFEAEKVET